MARLQIVASKDGVDKNFIYNNDTNEILFEDGTPAVVQFDKKETKEVFATSVDTPAGKVGSIRTLKIQLGLSCNYSCEYCSQRFVPHADSTNPSDVDKFIAQLDSWFDGGHDGIGGGVRVEFWGGEPFVYWKTLKPLAEKFLMKYPNAKPSVITNGSLLDDEKVAWLDALGFVVAVSHDGPGQAVRGPDPLEEESSRRGILKLIEVLGRDRVTINAMLHNKNSSRAEIVKWITDRVGDVTIGEGSFIDPYDEGGVSMSAPNGEWMVNFARQAFNEIRTEDLSRMSVVEQKVISFIESVLHGHTSSGIGQKCGMDKPENIAVDLNGNVLTCQNVSASSVAPNTKSHMIGNVKDLSSVKLNTSTHWKYREDCKSCPVLHLCRGGCMFLEGDRWEKGCNNAFIDNWVFFAVAFEAMTGHVPHTVIGGRKDRESPFHVIPDKPKKVFEIKPI